MTTEATTNPTTELPSIDSDWQRITLFLMLKLAGPNKTITLRADEMVELVAQFQPGMPVLLTTEHLDGVSFTVVDEAAAQRVASETGASNAQA